MRRFYDQLGRTVTLGSFPPRRIVSLVPSQTELLAFLGLERETVGITKFCVHPESWFRAKPRVGGTKQLHLDRIRALRPDLIIANKEENDREQVKALMTQFPVWVSDVPDLPAALDMIGRVGAICGRSARAAELRTRLLSRFDFAETAPDPPSTLYLIWRRPYMAAGGGTFIHDLLERADFRNVLADHRRYPELAAEHIAELSPEVIFLSSEPYPFQEKHREELAGICPRAVIELVDGEMFSWYGSRLLQAGPYLRSLREKIVVPSRE